LLLPFAVHAALGIWALSAWIHGPFGGAPLVDGAEVVAMAQGEELPFGTKSPLYPLLLRGVGTGAWAVGLLGLGLSLIVQVTCARWAGAVHGGRAGVVAAWLYASCGGAYAFAVQPLPAMAASACLVLGAYGLERPGAGDGPGDGASDGARYGARDAARGQGWSYAAAGALLATAALVRAPLVLCVLASLPWLAVRRGWRAAVGVAGGALAVACAGLLVFGERAWPEGGWLNTRLGNGGQRTGTTEVRPGPHYEQWRYDAVFDRRDGEGDYHRARLFEELHADPVGAATTVLRKAVLFWQPTEIVSAGDFRHGLQGFWPFALLSWSWAWLAPLGLVGLALRPRGSAWWPIAGVFAANVLVLTCARYRWPAAPLLVVVAAGSLAALRGGWGRRGWCGLALAAVLCWWPWTGRSWITPGDGLVQEGAVRLGRDPTRRDAAALDALRAAVAAGSEDPRAFYLLGLCHEARGETERALAAYDEALRYAPRFAQAAENRLRAMVEAGGFDERAREFARAAMQRIPHAGLLWLNVSRLDPELDPAQRRELEAEGLRRMRLRAEAERAQ